MADVVSNLKVRFSADTKNFKKDMESGKTAVKGFTDAGSNAFSQFAGLFGLNISAVADGMKAVEKQAQAMAAGFSGAAKSGNVLTAALKILKLAMIGTGIGALVVALGSLAAYFTRTEAGADKLSKLLAGMRGIIDVLAERFSKLGESIVSLFSKSRDEIEKTEKTLAQSQESGWKKYQRSIDDVNKSLEISNPEKAGIIKEMKARAAAAADLDEALDNLEDREISLIVVQERRKRQEADLRLAAENETKTFKERQEALKEASRIEEEWLSTVIELQQERVRIMTEQLNLKDPSARMADEIRALAEEEAKLEQLQEQSSKTQKKLLSGLNALTTQEESYVNTLKKEAESQAKANEERDKAIQKINELKQASDLLIKAGTIAPITGVRTVEPYKQSKEFRDEKAAENTPLQNTDSIMEGEIGKLEAYRDASQSTAESMKNDWLDATEVINDSLGNLTTGFGEAIGSMLAGSEGFKAIKQVALSSLADLAITVGKIAISTGMATEAIKLALTKLGGVGAIAAGVALVALGTAVKASLNNAANGGGTYSSNTGFYDTSGGYSYSGQSASLQSQPITIYLKGEFTQRGKDLVATIDQETNAQRIRK
jgi:hypothetical protein